MGKAGNRAASVIACAAMAVMIGGSHGVAQLSADQVAETGPKNEAVASAYRWQRIKSDVTYLKPSTPFEPDQSIKIAIPEAPKTDEEQVNDLKWTWGIAFGIVLALVIGIFIWQGARIGVRFRGTEERRRGGGARHTEENASALDDLPPDSMFDRIAAMADRRAALILLTSRALERAAQANNLHLGRAQTARDVVRVIPRAWQHRDGLAHLVREAEIVHFGGRDLPEARWADCLALARPIFGRTEGRAA